MKKGIICEFREIFFSIPPKQYALLSFLIGILLADELDIDEQNSLGSFLQSVGQTISMIATQRSLLENLDDKTDNTQDQIDRLTKQVEQLKKQIEKTSD